MSQQRSPRWIMHLDMDAFFAAVEQRDNPAYRGQPVIVGAQPGGRGVVATCSYEARRFGVHSAMPIAQAYARCPDAVYLRPDMARYSQVSQQIMQILRQISPEVEPVSVDEAFLDISGLERLYGTPEQIGNLARKKILEGVGLTCSVGIGPNRLVAKLASEYRKPDGLTVVAQEGVQAFLDPMPVANLRGVGPKTLRTVNRLGLKTVAQLRGMPLELLQQSFGEKGGQHLYDQARGLASQRVGNSRGRQSISKETTFAEDVSDQQLLRHRLRRLAGEVGRLTRGEGLKGRVVTLKVRLQGFETHTRQRQLGAATDSDQQLFQTAWALYQSSGHAGKPIRLIGLGLSGWGDDQGQTGDLFSAPENARQEARLYQTLDRITQRFGRDKLTWGVEKPAQPEDPDSGGGGNR